MDTQRRAAVSAREIHAFLAESSKTTPGILSPQLIVSPIDKHLNPPLKYYTYRYSNNSKNHNGAGSLTERAQSGPQARREEELETLALKSTEAILGCVREFFDARLGFLKQHLYTALKKMKHDQVIATMQGDPTTREFVEARLWEILQV